MREGERERVGERKKKKGKRNRKHSIFQTLYLEKKKKKKGKKRHALG